MSIARIATLSRRSVPDYAIIFISDSSVSFQVASVPLTFIYYRGAEPGFVTSLSHLEARIRNH